MGKAKTKAANYDYHKNEPPVVARQGVVARDYFSTTARALFFSLALAN